MCVHVQRLNTVLNVILALFDCANRAHEVEIRLTFVRPSVASIISEPITWIAFKV